MVGKTLSAVLATGALLSQSADATGATLVWPEGGQPIPNGSNVMLWEDFHLDPGPMAIPCQASPGASVVVNGQNVDEVRQRETPKWYECGSATVTGGWVAVGFTESSMKAVAVPAIVLIEPGGCTYALGEIEGHEGLAGYAVWEVSGSAASTGGNPSSGGPQCAPELPLKGTVELGAPQAGGFGVIPWASPPVGGEVSEGAAELNARMVTATRLAKLRRLFPSGPGASFSATGAGTLVVSWYAPAGGRSARAPRSPLGVLVASGRTVFSATGTKRLVARLTRRGKRLVRLKRHVTLGVRASFTPYRRAAVVVTGSSVLHR